MWAIFNFSFIPLVYFFYPETKGLHLEQVDHIFEGKIGITQGVRESIHSPLFVSMGDASRARATAGASDEEKSYVHTMNRSDKGTNKEDATLAETTESATRR